MNQMCDKTDKMLYESNLFTRIRTHTHMADEIDTDRNGMIDPQEFREYLEGAIRVGEHKGLHMDMQMVLQSAFRGSLLRVRKERGIICRAFLRASQSRKVRALVRLFILKVSSTCKHGVQVCMCGVFLAHTRQMAGMPLVFDRQICLYL